LLREYPSHHKSDPVDWFLKKQAKAETTNMLQSLLELA